MFANLKKLFSLLSPSQRRNLFLLQFLVIFMAFAEIASVFSIGPFIALIGNLDQLNGDGLIAEAYEDLLPHQWSKLIFNSAINSISAVTDLPHAKPFALQDNIEDLGNLVLDMMNEAKEIAAARGVSLADDPWLMNVNAVNRGSTSGEDYAHVPSMLDDVRNKRLTEVDWITGSIVREAKKAGVPAPYHETMYRLVKAFELSWTFENKGH